MLTQDDNELLTRVGPGTPAGELLRRYWQPVAVAGELTDQKPIKALRILGEDLVLYREIKGGYGLIARQCPHRGASLAYGRVDETGIRCPYHGWKFNAAGKCLETPAEPIGSPLKDRIKHSAYPVKKLGGMLFAYFGPEPIPVLPRWDVLAWENGKRWIDIQSVLECNWLQAMENSVDPAHLFWLHGAYAHLARVVNNYDEQHEFFMCDYGIMKRRTTPPRKPGDKGHIDQHPLLFPNTLRHVFRSDNDGGILHNLQYRVPVDDSHTQVFIVYFQPDDNSRSPADGDAPFQPFPARNDKGEYRLEEVLIQDAMAWESQGAISDRTQENLATSDHGVAMYRRLIREQIAVAQMGNDPLGILRNVKADRLIELDVVNERLGIGGPKKQAIA